MFPTPCVAHHAETILYKVRFAACFVALTCCSALIPNASTLCVNPRGSSVCKTTITAAVNQASPGDTVLIAPVSSGPNSTTRDSRT